MSPAAAPAPPRPALPATFGWRMAYQDRAKAEQEVLDHIKKALTDQETAPKQKHVRGTAVDSVELTGRRRGRRSPHCSRGRADRAAAGARSAGIILYSHSFQNTAAFWTAIKSINSVAGDEIVCYKTLITIHKLLRDGHPSVRSRRRRRRSAAAWSAWTHPSLAGAAAARAGVGHRRARSLPRRSSKSSFWTAWRT